MDYKYIEQLLEQYWECQTSLEEEDILRSFFAQDDVPARLLPYRALFQVEQRIKQESCLDESFDRKIMDMIEVKEETQISAKRINMRLRLEPFYKVAAVLAIVLSIGMAAQYGWKNPQETQFAQQKTNQCTDSTSILPTDAATATATQTIDSMGVKLAP